MHHARRRAPFACALIALLAPAASGQTSAPRRDINLTAAAQATNGTTGRAGADRDAGDEAGAAEVRRQLREQREEIERLRESLGAQARLLEELRARVERAESRGGAAASGRADAPAAQRLAVFKDTLPSSASPAAAGPQAAPKDAQAVGADERLTRVEAEAKRASETLTRQLGSISFSGDIRFRHEATFGQQNALPNSDDPSVLGNELSSRQRLRVRARLALRGQIGKEFDWGIRFATGAYPDVNSTNQTLTDFFSRKSFMLDQAYVTYRPAAAPGLQLQGGKFDVPWLRTELTIDNDLTVEGANESYTREFKKSALRSLTFVAWQLPFLERNAAFVLGSDGRVDLEASRRGGRDLALYGAQFRARFEPTKTVALTLSAADLFYSGTQFITPAQFFGGQIQFPVTVRIPATATAPAQTVTTQVSIPRELLVSGNANLGASIASTNATNRDGRLSSGFNLVDLIARLDLTGGKRWPVTLLFNFVTNTQARDVDVAGPGGTNIFLENDERNGYWAEPQIGQTRNRGDWLFNYTLTRIQKDAVLTPFNFSDIAQQSDVLAQRFIVAYAADPRVVLSLTGLVSTRPNGLLGPFSATPAGSLNRLTTRFQLDTVFRF